MNMKGLSLKGRLMLILILFSIIPVTGMGYLLTERYMEELEDKSMESLLDIVKGKSDLYGKEFLEFKTSAESLASYIANVWGSNDGYANYSYIWISPNGTGYNEHREEIKNYEAVWRGLQLVSQKREKIELAYLGTESGVVFFDKPIASIIKEKAPFDHRMRPWYTLAKEKNDTIWTPVYIDANTGKLVTTVATPVYVNKKFLGVVGLDLLLETIQQDILDTRFIGAGYAILVDNNGNIIVHPEYTAEGKKWNDTFREINIMNISGLKKAGEDMINGTENVRQIEINGKRYYVAYAPVGEINGSLAFLIEKGRIMQPIISLRNGVYMAIAVLGIFGVTLSLIFSKSITTPLEKLKKGAEEVAKGNFEYKIKGGGGDEIGMVTDAFNRMVQELKKSRESLKESERKYRELFESSKDVVYITTKDGKILDINKAGEELFGYTKKELLEMNASDMYLNKEDREKFQRKIEKDGFVKDYEVKFKRKDGKVLDCLLTTTAKTDSNGEVIGYYGIIRDVTEIKDAERKIEAYNILMRHDINNRNQIAIGYLEILRDMDLTEEQKEYVERILKVVKASQNLLDRVRALSKAREKHRLSRKNIEDVVRKAIREYAHAATRKGIRIFYKGRSIDVIADDMAENIFSNIIENAITHSGCSKIEISVEEEDNFCKVSIEDDGKGIPKELKESLFLFGVKGKDSPGSGLGLHLVKTIVEGYGGFIKVKDRKGGGTIFEIYLKKWE